jgi:hypothetical protein
MEFLNHLVNTAMPPLAIGVLFISVGMFIYSCVQNGFLRQVGFLVALCMFFISISIIVQQNEYKRIEQMDAQCGKLGGTYFVDKNACMTRPEIIKQF